MNKQNKNWLLLTGVLAAGLIATAPQNAFAGKEKADKTAKTEQKADKNQNFKSNTTLSLDGTKVVYNGVAYSLSGDLKVKVSVKTKKDDRTDVKAQLNAAGLKVTAPDGTTYNGVGVINLRAKTDEDNTNFKANANVGLIGQGKAPNFRLKLKLRGTVDAGNAHQVVLYLDGADMS